MMDLSQVIEHLHLKPLEGEGGMWAPIFNHGHSSAIYFLMQDPDFSAWHRIPQQEMWIHVAGSPTILYTYDEGGACMKRILDRSSLDCQALVLPHQWMAAKPLGEWSLLICALTPAFTEMELASVEEVRAWMIKDLPESEKMGLIHD